MSSPFLDLALGALSGANANRRTAIEAEERRRKQQREDFQTRLELAKLSSDPDFEVTPFVDAAIGGAPAGGEPPGSAAALPPPPGPPALPQLGARGQPLEGQQPTSVGRPAAGAGTGGAAVAPPPGSEPTPFLEAGLDLGNVEVGGRKYSVKAKPGRARARSEATNRAAYEALHRADPEAYPEFIENMPAGYYGEELSDYAQGVRAGRIEDKRARREGTAAQARSAIEARRDAARDQVFSLAQDGRSFEEVVAALSQDHELRGVLTRSEIRREMQSAGQINAPARDKAQRMSTLKTQLGKPPTATTGAAIDAELQQDIIESLADGHTAEEILDQLADAPTVPTVRRWLRRGRQLTRPPTY